MTDRWSKGLGLLVFVMSLAACASMGEQAKREPSLYQRLGGREGIALLVDDFVANVVADDRINARFKGLSPPAMFKFKSNFSDQVCEATGGPCAYLGRDMKVAHKGMNIREAEWNATVEALVKALNKRQLSEKEKSELLALLGSMKNDILGQ